MHCNFACRPFLATQSLLMSGRKHRSGSTSQVRCNLLSDDTHDDLGGIGGKKGISHSCWVWRCFVQIRNGVISVEDNSDVLAAYTIFVDLCLIDVGSLNLLTKNHQEFGNFLQSVFWVQVFCASVTAKLIGVRSVDVLFRWCSFWVLCGTVRVYDHPRIPVLVNYFSSQLSSKTIPKKVAMDFSLLIYVVLKGTFHAVAMETNPPWTVDTWFLTKHHSARLDVVVQVWKLKGTRIGCSVWQ